MKVLITEARDGGVDTLALLDATYFSIQMKQYKESGCLIIKTGDIPYYSSLCFTKEQFDEYLSTLKSEGYLDLSGYIFKMDDSHSTKSITEAKKDIATIKKEIVDEIVKATNFIKFG